jgi:hypothetical protein
MGGIAGRGVRRAAMAIVRYATAENLLGVPRR